MDNQQVMITEDEALGLQIPLSTYLKQHLDRGYKVQYSYEHEAVGTVYILDKEEPKEERMYTLEEMKKAYETFAYLSASSRPYNQKELDGMFNEFLKTLN